MKQKLLLIALFVVSALSAVAQTVTYPVSDMVFCGYPGPNSPVNLRTQIPVALGNQDPDMHVVNFFHTLNDAQFGSPFITNASNFSTTQSTKTIYMRVERLGEDFVILTFNIVFHSLSLPDEMYYHNCNSYTLPALGTTPLGVTPQYYTGPNGTGTIVPAGTAITQSTTLYVHAVSGTCTANTIVNIEIWDIPDNNPAPYVVCTDNGMPAVFDLTSRIPALTGQMQWAMVDFFPTEADAIANTNEITNAQAYMATSALQTIYARIILDGSPMCYWYKPLLLATETCTTNLISGTVRFDVDGGGCGSAQDIPAQGIPVYNIAGPNTYQTITDANGNYSFNGTPDVSNVVLITQTQLPFAASPAVHQIAMPAIATGKDFCLTVPNPVQDVGVSLVPITQARPGFPVAYSLIYSNAGTLPADGTVTVYFPITKMTYVSSNPEVLVNGNALTMSFTNMQPLQSRSIYITFQVLPPQVVPLGDVLTFAAVITMNGTDSNQSDNTAVVNQAVVNSYDPNDISVLEGEYITEAQADGYLHYTIRFQNIGNADALKVKIENTLDGQLDFGSLQPLSASHPYHLQRRNDQLTIVFDNINLPGSQVNEPASHGYITYRVKPNATVGVGDVIGNSASIYFDFNDPIVTNTVTTTIQAAAGVKDFAANGFSMYPNPANGLVTVKLAEESNADVTVTDVLGKTVMASVMAGREQNLDIAALNAGIYFVKVTLGGQSATEKLVVK